MVGDSKKFNNKLWIYFNYFIIVIITKHGYVSFKISAHILGVKMKLSEQKLTVHTWY